MIPLPVPDRDSAPWWEALGRHELVVQSCRACGRLRWPPRAMCGECASFEWAWLPVSGRATVVSWIVNHHRFGDAFPERYAVVAARLDEQDDIVIPAGFEEDDPAVGTPVAAAYHDEGAATLLRWRPLR